MPHPNAKELNQIEQIANDLKKLPDRESRLLCSILYGVAGIGFAGGSLLQECADAVNKIVRAKVSDIKASKN
jgi:hypothetical protein